MQISKITSLYNIVQRKYIKNNEEKKAIPKVSNPSNNITFEAQVDKGLVRFYQYNQARMPITVERYVRFLDNKTLLSPLEAQRRAFSRLKDAKTIQDVKKFFEGEELFSDLKNPEDSKAKRGLINLINSDKELFELYDIGALNNKKNLTVYLLQKIFLEGKTIEEINEDLEKDLNPDFKADFKIKNPDSKFIYTTTLKSLGIKTPHFEYQQSLRYTREGYSDVVGAKIQQGLRTFWDMMPESERTARAKKSVAKFENWWASFSTSQKLDMIADKMNESEMLKLFKKSERQAAKQEMPLLQVKAEAEAEDVLSKKKTKVGSEKLKQDDLFIKWATANLKTFEASLSEAEKDTLHLKRMQRLAKRWANMSSAEKTDYISKMKSGAEPLKYTMVDAWNHSEVLIKALSMHLKSNQIYKTADMLYSSQEFSEFQSRVMTEFWQTNPKLATEFGEQIIKSQEKVNFAIQNGTFSELKKQIMRDKSQRIKNISKFKQSIQEMHIEPETNIQGDYIAEFKHLYLKNLGVRLHNIPDAYMEEYFSSIKDLPKEYILSWTKNLRGESLTEEDEINLQNLIKANSEMSLYEANRAIEATLSNVLYEYTHNPEVYTLSFSDVKTAIYKLEINENPIEFHSIKLHKDFSMPVIKKVSINKKQIENLYREYRKGLSDEELDEILHNYFVIASNNGEQNQNLVSNRDAIIKLLKVYIRKYNKSILISFSDKSTFKPEIKDAFFRKFIANIPREILSGPIKPAITSLQGFQYEDQIKLAKKKYQEKFSFLPKTFVDSYFAEIANMLRLQKGSVDVEKFINTVCKKRVVPNETGKMFFFNKKDLYRENKYKALAMEQALADVLYEATGEENVYTLGLESLCDNLEIYSLVKKYPTSPKVCPETLENSQFTMIAKQRPNFSKIRILYENYMQEIEEWKQSNIVDGKQPDYEDFLYILNPDEGMATKDFNVAMRMARYGLML